MTIRHAVSYHGWMADLPDGYEAELERALHRRGDPMTAREFLSVLAEVSGVATEPLSAGERAFLLDNTDLTEADLSSAGHHEAQLRIAASRVNSVSVLEEGSLSTAQVAALLGRDEANVRRSRLKGDLYSPSAGTPGQSLRFPAWQFVEGRVVPGLRQIIPVMPAYYHPLSIRRFMTTPNDELDGLSPVQWLSQGGPTAVVVRLADELGYE